ncbi:MAG: ABC transporter ATP-binding protein [Clostridia bacterium]|nr:ABC transporter ATP-binding protein [Clostridia bacterium]
MSVIKTERINKIYKTKAERIVAVREVSIDIRAGEFVGIIGSSGSGKSTLMNILGCLDKPSGGKYFFENRNIANFKEGELTALRRDNIGFVFQKFNLIQTLNALENVELPLLYAKMPKKKRRQKAKTALETVGLENRINHKPYELSGGQQQRVAIARAIVGNPEIILADEPTGNLDSDSTKQIMKILKDLNKKGKTVIIITHDREIAEQTDRKIIVKNGRVDVSV